LGCVNLGWSLLQHPEHRVARRAFVVVLQLVVFQCEYLYGASEGLGGGLPFPAFGVGVADPVTLLLVSYGRMPLGRALLRGGMLAWGRPWLGLRFKGMFFNP
jgi:hypothetical protein